MAGFHRLPDGNMAFLAHAEQTISIAIHKCVIL